MSDDQQICPPDKDEEWEAAAVAAVQSFSTSMPKGWADLLAMTDDLTRLYAPAADASPEAIAETSNVSPKG